MSNIKRRKRPVLVIISGLPGTGKSTIAQAVGIHFSLPYFGKDQFKELIFDNIEFSDRCWSQRVGAAAFEILLNTAQTLLRSGQSVILESNFKPEFDSQRFSKMQDDLNCFNVQIHCHGNLETVVSRFTARVSSGLRHPGHAEKENLEKFIAGIRACTGSELLLDCPTLLLNTTDLPLDENIRHSMNFLAEFLRDMH